MSVDVKKGKHYPKNSMLFEFDSEVISVFDNMANRSIMGYDLAYKSIAYLIQRYPIPEYSYVCDMGTTTGKGLKTVREAKRYDPLIKYVGFDISQDSVDRVANDCPWADIIKADLREGFPDTVLDGEASIIIFGWTLQFIEDREARVRLIEQSYKKLRKGGMLIIMEKYTLDDDMQDLAYQDAYIQFRRDNGYSVEEIQSKTSALKNAMWTTSPKWIEDKLQAAGFSDVQVLYRQLNFGGVFAEK